MRACELTPYRISAINSGVSCGVLAAAYLDNVITLEEATKYVLMIAEAVGAEDNTSTDILSIISQNMLTGILLI